MSAALNIVQKLTLIKNYNLSAICTLASSQLSPLKMVKCKVGYQTSSSDESSNMDKVSPPNKQLCLLDLGATITVGIPQEGEDKADISMKDVA